MIVPIAVERKGDGVGKKLKRWKLGRARTELVPDVTRETLLAFVERNRELGSTIHTDGLEAYKEPAAVDRATACSSTGCSRTLSRCGRSIRR